MTDEERRGLVEAAIVGQESLRGALGDDIVDITIEALHRTLHDLDPRREVERERRLVTVLFVDVVESTRIFSGVDPEETMAILDGALQTLAEPVRSHGGRVTRFMGDGFLAVFGLGRTRENDAEMAVRAALEVIEVSASIATAIERTHAIPDVAVRVGINTGLVVAGGTTEAEDTVMGSAVNLAARIEAAAPPGGILVSQSTYRQVRGRFVLEPAGTIEAKGFSEPVPVHLVTGVSVDGGASGERDTFDTDLVGRSEPLSALRVLLDEVVADGTGRFVTVVGEAGIGKSRLVAEFVEGIRTPVTTLGARGALEASDTPHALLRDLVGRCFGIRPADTPIEARRKLADGFGGVSPGGPVGDEVVEAVSRFVGYGPGDREPEEGTGRAERMRARSLHHLVEYFAALAADRPLVLVLEDMQWADPGSISALVDLLTSLAHRPVLGVALARREFLDRHGSWGDLRRHRTIELSPLDGDDAARLLDSLLAPVEDLPRDLRARLLEHGGGNPYYLEELVMMCIDEGIIVTDEPRWYVRGDRLAALRVPNTLTGVIRARLDSLDDTERAVLERASVVGRVFWDDAVARLGGSRSDVEDALPSLVARGMLHRRETTAFPNTVEYAFATNPLRDATYDAVLLGTRRRYHGIVADWIVEMSGDRSDEIAGLIGTHLELAGRGGEALEHLARAARFALGSYSVTAAAELYDRALALATEGDLEQRYELLLGRARVAALQGDRDDQRRLLAELDGVAATIGDASKQALIAIERTFLRFYLGDYAASIESGWLAVGRADTTDDPALRSRAHTTLGWAFFYLGDRESARSHAQQGLELAAGAAPGEATAENLLGLVALDAHEFSEARRRLDRAVQLAIGIGDRDGALTYRNNALIVLTLLGHYREATEQWSEILEEAIESGDRVGESSTHVNLAWVGAAVGDWDAARRHAELGVAMKRRQEHPEAEAEGLLWLGHALVGLGSLAEAAAAYEASAALRAELGQVELGLGVRAGQARLELALGEVANAMGHADAILDHLDRGRSLEGTWEPFRIHLSAIDALRAAGDPRAGAALERAHRLLLESADKISDEADRQSYLRSVPWHRRIVELRTAST